VYAPSPPMFEKKRGGGKKSGLEEERLQGRILYSFRSSKHREKKRRRACFPSQLHLLQSGGRRVGNLGKKKRREVSKAASQKHRRATSLHGGGKKKPTQKEKGGLCAVDHDRAREKRVGRGYSQGWWPEATCRQKGGREKGKRMEKERGGGGEVVDEDRGPKRIIHPRFRIKEDGGRISKEKGMGMNAAFIDREEEKKRKTSTSLR